MRDYQAQEQQNVASHKTEIAELPVCLFSAVSQMSCHGFPANGGLATWELQGSRRWVVILPSVQLPYGLTSGSFLQISNCNVQSSFLFQGLHLAMIAQSHASRHCARQLQTDEKNHRIAEACLVALAELLLFEITG